MVGKSDWLCLAESSSVSTKNNTQIKEKMTGVERQGEGTHTHLVAAAMVLTSTAEITVWKTFQSAHDYAK